MTGWKARLKMLAGALRRRHVHLTIRGAGSEDGFGVIGTPHVTAHFSRIYLGELQPRRQPGLHFDGGLSAARQLTARFGLTVISEVDLPPALESESLRVPVWVAVQAAIPASVEEHLSGMSRGGRSDVSKIRRAGYSYETCADPAWAEEFYERYHRASIVARHGEEGFVMDAAEIRRVVAEGHAEFIRVMRDGRCDGALLGFQDGDGYRMGRLGWREGDPTLVRDGVVAAIYWFSFARGRELGKRELRFGGTPAYVEDGVLLTKMKWGGVLSRAGSTYGERFLHLDPSHARCRRMFAERSFIAFGSRGDFVVFSGRAPSELKVPTALLAQFSAWYRLRDVPSPDGGYDDPSVPARLRPWFENVLCEPRLGGDVSPCPLLPDHGTTRFAAGAA